MARSILLMVCILTSIVSAQSVSEKIRINQIGFYPQGEKIAAVVESEATDFHLTTADGADTVYTGQLTPSRFWDLSDENVALADFTAWTEPGEYVLLVAGVGVSHPFKIKPYVHQRVAMWSLKGYYFQRASMALDESYAGKWKRKLGHPDNKVYVHESAATTLRPKDTIISSSRGWYDAGDYNKYIVNSGISTYTLLQIYENYPEYCQSLNTYIPESDNALPDVLDEALWNIRWMLTMQDPNDGGVYHKLTNENFDGFVMPHAATSKRYVVQKSTAAALDLAAVAAVSARIFREYEAYMPGFADSCQAAALAAWNWARKNPMTLYKQSDMNKLYNPDINTGEYGNSTVTDEFQWAAMELFITTLADSFLTITTPFGDANTSLPSWPNVRTLGFYSLLQHENQLPDVYDKSALRSRIVNWANSLKSGLQASPYHIVMGKSKSDFNWGSNAVAANQAVALIMAYRVSGDEAFLAAALTNLDYLLGRNATGYCFVTGLGSKSPKNIHHRQSGADGILDPVPGLLAGGPNPNQEDKGQGGVVYPSNSPARSFVDVQGSYASNEICINWNAPMAYAACAIEAIMAEQGRAEGSRVEDNEPLVETIALLPSYPNPFNANTTVRWRLKDDSYVEVIVYNVRGERAAILVQEQQSRGEHMTVWRAEGLPTGIYIVALKARERMVRQKVMLVK